jgi:hypothetical protein
MLNWKFDKYSMSNGMWQEMWVEQILICNFKWKISFIILIYHIFGFLNSNNSIFFFPNNIR